MRPWSSRLQSAAEALRALVKPVASAIKVGIVAWAMAWLVPFVFVNARIGPRLDANIYDFYAIIFLLWIAWKNYITERKIDIINNRLIEWEKPITLEIQEDDIKNLKRLKKKLDRRRKRSDNSEKTKGSNP